jgi:glutamate:GABA antiporter
VLVQTIIATIITLIAFVLPYAFSGGSNSAGDLSTKVYDILQAAVTVIWCISMVILFVDVIIIRSKFPAEFAAKQLTAPWVFYLCAVVGMLASAVGIVVTFQNPWTTLIGEQDWWVLLAIIGLASLAVGAIVYVVGEATVAKGTPPAPTEEGPAHA